MSYSIDASMFRAYDIRGLTDQTMTEEAVRLIGLAIGSEAKNRKENTIIVGRDGRLSGPTLAKALIEGLRQTGCSVIDIGSIPTPLLYFATHVLETHSGVMLTGSHNPPNYNGIKIVLQGETLFGDAIQALYQRIVNNHLFQSPVLGSLQTMDLIDRYIDRIANDVKLKKSLRIVLDCGNGIGGVVAPQLYRKLGCEVFELFCEVDGHFPHHHPDPSEKKNLQDLIKAVKEKKADIGIALDGDADRLGVVTDQGTFILPDHELMAFAEDLLERHPQATIIYDIKCTNHLRELILKKKGKPVMWKTGHALIKSKMKETQALLAGEMSGHIFFQERWYGFDDGIYAGARLLEIISKKSMTSDQFFKRFPDSFNTPELKLPVEDSHKFEWMEKIQKQASFPGAQLTTIDGIRADFKNGWGLVRASNTTPYLVLRFEANSEKDLKDIQAIFRKELLKVNPTFELPF